MENTNRLVVLLTLLSLTLSAAQSQEKTSPRLSGTRTASCLVKITSDPAVLPLSFETIDYLLHSSGVGGKTAREVLGISPDQVQDLFFIEYVHESASNAPPKSSMGRSTGSDDGMDEYEYAMMMDAEYGREMARNVPGLMPGPSTSSSGGKGSSSSSSSRNQPFPRTMMTSFLPGDEQTYLFSLNIRLPEEVKPAAEEFLDALITNLRNALTNAFDEHALRLKGQLQLAEEEAGRAEHELQTWQNRLREISGSHVLDLGSIIGEMNNLRKEIQQIEMKYICDQVTIEATAKRIAELQARIQAEIEKDTITDELKRLLELQEHNLGNVEKLSDSGRASPTDLADAQEKMTRARIELAQRQEQLSKSKGGDQIGPLNSTLADLSMGIAQSEAMRAGYQRQLTQAEALLGKADGYELFSLKADVAKQNLQEILLWRDRMARQIRIIQPPAVSVIGGD